MLKRCNNNIPTKGTKAEVGIFFLGMHLSISRGGIIFWEKIPSKVKAKLPKQHQRTLNSLRFIDDLSMDLTDILAYQTRLRAQHTFLRKVGKSRQPFC